MKKASPERKKRPIVAAAGRKASGKPVEPEGRDDQIEGLDVTELESETGLGVGPAPSPPSDDPMPGVDGVRRIQKYPNRRLYDRSTSSHLTHEALYELVAAGQRVQVVDSRTGEDLTTVVLAQVLIEHDPLKFSAIPPELLHLLIRTNRGVLPALQRSMIEAVSSAAAGWIAWQERMASLFAPGAQRSIDWMTNSLSPLNPLNPLNALNQLNEVKQRNVMMQAPTAAPSSSQAQAPTGPQARSTLGDAATLRAEVAALREELEALRRAGSVGGDRARASQRTGNASRRRRSA